MKNPLSLFARFARTKQRPQTPKQISGGDFANLASTICAGGNTVKLTAGRITSILADADNGQTAAYAELGKNMLEKESTTAAHICTRIMAVLACDWSIKADDEQMAGEAASMLAQAGIRGLMKHLLSAIHFGYAAGAILWKEGGDGIEKFIPFDPANVIFDADGNPAFTGRDGHEHGFCEYHENQFILHTHGSPLESTPARGGLIRPLAWLYFFKHYAMRDRARYLERFGIPFIAAKIRSEDFESEDVRNNVLDSLSKISSDGVGLLSEGSELEIVDPPSGSSSDYQSYLDYLDKLCAMLILGQTASSGDASGLSKGQIQENVRRDIIEADAKNLMETIDAAIIRPYEKFKYGTVGNLHFNLDYASPENLLEKAQIVRELASAGAKISEKWMENTFAIQMQGN